MSPALQIMGIYEINFSSMIGVSDVQTLSQANIPSTTPLVLQLVLPLQILGTVATYAVIVAQFAPFPNHADCDCSTFNTTATI